MGGGGKAVCLKSDGGTALRTRGWRGPRPLLPRYPPAQVDRSTPGSPRTLPGCRRAPRGPATLVPAFLSQRPPPAQQCPRGVSGQAEGLELRLPLAFVPRPVPLLRWRTPAPLHYFLLPPSPPAPRGVFGLSPLHSARPALEKCFQSGGMVGLGLVSMTTGRKRWVINPSPPSRGEGGSVGAGK